MKRALIGLWLITQIVRELSYQLRKKWRRA